MDKKKKIISSIIGIIVVLLAGYFGIDLTQDSKVPKDSKLMISYMDVVQGDAAYIKVNGNDILIDAGPRSNSKELLEQLKAKNIDDFELVIATHPHEDHIGGMVDDYSPIMKLSFGDTSYLFTGDAEKLAEEEALAKYKTSLDSDVIKFGHHGSSSSSSNAFIEAVSPKYGIISCAKDNKYGHPHRETLDIIKKYNIKTFRTDTDGEIILTSDGKSINFN